jgi:hypothetical protein
MPRDSFVVAQRKRYALVAAVGGDAERCNRRRSRTVHVVDGAAQRGTWYVSSYIGWERGDFRGRQLRCVVMMEGAALGD